MLAKIARFVKANQAEIILVLAVILISLLSFSLGYLSFENDNKKEIRIEQN
jgi:predicted RND superfamily exporter protein